MEDLFEAMPGNYYTRHALGMLCVGLMMLLLLARTPATTTSKASGMRRSWTYSRDR